MKRPNALMLAVLILILGLIGFSQGQTNTGETADELLGKSIEYFDKKDATNAGIYLMRAIELDPSKKDYIKILLNWKIARYAEALKLLEQRKKNHPPEEKERKAMQVLASSTHCLWAKELEKKNQYLDAIAHYEAAYVIDIIYRRKNAANELHKIGFLYNKVGQKQKSLDYFEKALPILLEVGDLSSKATTLEDLARVS